MINNPVFHKEIRRLRLRQSNVARSAIAVIALVMLGLVYWLVHWGLSNEPGASAGRTAWMILVSVQYLLICLVAPAIAANAITQEKEQQTWDMLLHSRLYPAEIILGKLVARLIAVVVLILAFLPLAIYCWFHAAREGVGSYHYITPARFLAAYGVMFISAVFFTTVGLFLSWLLDRTLYAIMLSYTFVVGGLCIATFLVTAALSSLVSDYRFFEKCPLMWVNPAAMMSNALSSDNINDTLFMVYGLLCYVILTLILLWRMINGFRRFAYR